MEETSINQTSKWLVFPDDANRVSIPLTSDERKTVHGLHPALSLLIGIFLWMATVIVTGSFILGIVLAVSAVVAIHILLVGARIAEFERKKADLHNSNSIRNAQSLTSRLTSLYKTSEKLLPQLQSRLNDAYSWLPHAETEYKSNAFSSFWDAIENSTRILGDFNGLTHTLTSNAAEYYRLLSGCKHTFPSFPVQNGSIPDPTFTIGEMQRIARLGQTNFQFANIWEHRRNREVLIAGFSTLGDAIYNLGTVIEDSFASLQHSVSSNVAKLVEQEIATRERLETRMSLEGSKNRTALSDFKKSVDSKMDEQNEMLDNIQRGRKPGVFGGFIEK